MKKAAATYVRVSTPDQHVESQLYDLRELASQRGFEVVANDDCNLAIAIPSGKLG
jgi:DNA invertase Pin-like site-specific DNA recombinase